MAKRKKTWSKAHIIASIAYTIEPHEFEDETKGKQILHAVDQILSGSRAVWWSPDDVAHLASLRHSLFDLDPLQAPEILERVINEHNPEHGITWDIILDTYSKHGRKK